LLWTPSLLKQLSLVKLQRLFESVFNCPYILVSSFVGTGVSLSYSFVMSCQLKLRCAISGSDTTVAVTIRMITNLELCENANLNYRICYRYRFVSDSRYIGLRTIQQSQPPCSTSDWCTLIMMRVYQMDGHRGRGTPQYFLTGFGQITYGQIIGTDGRGLHSTPRSFATAAVQ
jgi:hypothetical protein